MRVGRLDAAESLDGVGIGSQLSISDALAELPDELQEPIFLIVDKFAAPLD